MPCVHRAAEVEGASLCTSDHVSARPGLMPDFLCGREVCPFYNVPNQTSQGFGDTLHKLSHAVGIDRALHKILKDCGCAKRKSWLNRVLPFRHR
jgi:hypothetical protein